MDLLFYRKRYREGANTWDDLLSLIDMETDEEIYSWIQDPASETAELSGTVIA